jgi:hypothetical protein
MRTIQRRVWLHFSSGMLLALASANMKRTFLIVLIFLTTFAQADPGKRRTKLERKTARVERQYARKAELFDKRTPEEKKKDRAFILYMALGVSLIVSAMKRGE